jgi:transcription elongation factor Elf1
MNLHTSIDAEDPTVDTLYKTDRRLAIFCRHCGRFRYMNFARFTADQKVSSLSETLSCASCGSQDVEAVAVSRDPDNGYWPAEHS